MGPSVQQEPRLPTYQVLLLIACTLAAVMSARWCWATHERNSSRIWIPQQGWAIIWGSGCNVAVRRLSPVAIETHSNLLKTQTQLHLLPVIESHALNIHF
ncbi:hypothetical protein ASPSYDRAFT_42009 [Aspergillus sydowii CBS 593.65]|uniref:Uncharacterized protein n=1 Tax=Aspergillus sydowii CBS 593.65 TaxID=1036612 RepID=A0A1L9TLL8_9EURO|nr:uncharacterized protein ASPSYDRAFT_42009 [Aspergillus sydowii CBS 593.65]OJJ60282.1 hypothetical protein ASPSYDRAFT_42009 [Aspergillus sydowii CBS 593.65]